VDSLRLPSGDGDVSVAQRRVERHHYERSSISEYIRESEYRMRRLMGISILNLLSSAETKETTALFRDSARGIRRGTPIGDDGYTIETAFRLEEFIGRPVGIWKIAWTEIMA